MKKILEVIAFNIESCQLAEQNGADRIELCDNSCEGGTTPSVGMIISARKKTTIELFPIIRPRGGDFLYSHDEFDIMIKDIEACKEAGCEGVVIGILQNNGKIDANRTSKLVRIAYPMSVTFHRAFDRTPDAMEAMETIIDCGCDRILTSGLCTTAIEGANLIKELVEKSEARIIIMPGSGIRSGNIKELAFQTGATEFHSSARKNIHSKMSYNNPNMKDNNEIVMLDSDEVINMVQILHDLP